MYPGFIDIAELAFLCAELGEALDRYFVARKEHLLIWFILNRAVSPPSAFSHNLSCNKPIICSSQLAEAFKLLDKNNDQKIDFSEFYSWWSDESRVKGGKSDIALAGVRGQLLLHRGQRYVYGGTSPRRCPCPFFARFFFLKRMSSQKPLFIFSQFFIRQMACFLVWTGSQGRHRKRG